MYTMETFCVHFWHVTRSMKEAESGFYFESIFQMGSILIDK